MLQITPHMKILVAVEPADFRRGIDGLARLCQETLQHDPFDSTGYGNVTFWITGNVSTRWSSSLRRLL